MSIPETSGPKTLPQERLGRRQASVEVDRGDDRLEGVGEERELLGASGARLPRPHPQEPPDPERAAPWPPAWWPRPDGP